MYFNLDRLKKQKILNNYKKDLLDFQKKKEEAKKLRIEEERNFLHEIEIKQQESEEKIFQEKNRKKKALMAEYLDMLKKSKNYLPGYHFKPKNSEIIINNWGKSKEEFLKENNDNNNVYHTIEHKYNNKSYEINNFNSLSEREKVREIIKPVDSMKKFLTDEPNENEVNSYFLKKRQNKQNYYKDLLYSQHNDSVKNNMNIYGTEDILILKQKKKKLITDNPYREKNEYGFGDSCLENNPILNPENNMRYNKYFQELYPDLLTNKVVKKNYMQDNNSISKKNNYNISNNINIEISNNNKMINDYNYINRINNNIYKNKNNNIEKGENNMAINGSNIINNFNRNEGHHYLDYYKNDINNNIPYLINNNNHNKILSRNFSDIYNNPRIRQDSCDINSNNNEGYMHKILDNSRRSMSQNHF